MPKFDPFSFDLPVSEIILEVKNHLSASNSLIIQAPPGAGKSTLVNAIIHHLSRVKPGIRIAILAVDPTSPFTSGSLLGDRLRMTGHFNNPNIYIRSLATRGHLGGLSARTIEVVDILRSAPFDLILVETVGVGQSEALTRFNTASKPLLRD